MIWRSELSVLRVVSLCPAVLAASTALVGCASSDGASIGRVEQALGTISITGIVVNAQGNPTSRCEHEPNGRCDRHDEHGTERCVRFQRARQRSVRHPTCVD